MGAFEKFFGGAFALILVYLLVKNAAGVNAILTGFARGSSQVFATLQGSGGGIAGIGAGSFSPSVNIGVG
jgi:hypothetical protein